jgi:hypothetical protein
MLTAVLTAGAAATMEAADALLQRAEEFDTLAGIRYNPASLLACDQPMIDLFTTPCTSVSRKSRPE